MNSLGALLSGKVTSGQEQQTIQGYHVTILTGFLGAGKTTLLRHLIAASRPDATSVIVNDFGSVNIDASSIKGTRGDVVSLENGCSCCAMGGDFGNALQNLSNSINSPKHILVEASGLADPAALATIADMRFGAGASRVVTLVDAVNFSHSSKSQGAKMLLMRQIESAHLIVLTKTEQLDPSQIHSLTRAIAAIAPGRSIVENKPANNVVSLIMEKVFGGARPTPHVVPHNLDDFGCKTLTSDRAVDLQTIRAVIERAPPSVIRIKGAIELESGDTLLVQCVGTDRRFDLNQPDTQTPKSLVVFFLKTDPERAIDWLRQITKIVGIVSGK